jgi:hypothetical protein
MGRVITAHETCDRCKKKIREIEVDTSVETPEAVDEFSFTLNFNPKEVDEDHPTECSGNFGVLCDKCKLRIADCMAMAMNLKVPKRRKAKDTEPVTEAE